MVRFRAILSKIFSSLFFPNFSGIIYEKFKVYTRTSAMGVV